MLKTYLMENYGYNEPIFLNDLTIQGLSECSSAGRETTCC